MHRLSIRVHYAECETVKSEREVNLAHRPDLWAFALSANCFRLKPEDHVRIQAIAENVGAVGQRELETAAQLEIAARLPLHAHDRRHDVRAGHADHRQVEQVQARDRESAG